MNFPPFHYQNEMIKWSLEIINMLPCFCFPVGVSRTSPFSWEIPLFRCPSSLWNLFSQNPRSHLRTRVHHLRYWHRNYLLMLKFYIKLLISITIPIFHNYILTENEQNLWLLFLQFKTFLAFIRWTSFIFSKL